MTTIRSSQGFSLIESLLALAVTSFVLAATAYFLMAEGNSYKGQKERLSIEDNGRMMTDFVTRMLKGATAIAPISISGTSCANTVNFHYGEAFGMSTGGNTGTTLNDTGRAWTANQWNGYKVVITGGGGSSQIRTITSNTATQLVLSTTWTTVPDTTSLYKIVSEQRFSLAGTNLQYQNISAGSGSETLADRIACFSVQQDGTHPTQYNLTMTAQTTGALPDTGRVGTTTFQSSVDVRN